MHPELFLCAVCWAVHQSWTADLVLQYPIERQDPRHFVSRLFDEDTIPQLIVSSLERTLLLYMWMIRTNVSTIVLKLLWLHLTMHEYSSSLHKLPCALIFSLHMHGRALGIGDPRWLWLCTCSQESRPFQHGVALGFNTQCVGCRESQATSGPLFQQSRCICKHDLSGARHIWSIPSYHYTWNGQCPLRLHWKEINNEMPMIFMFTLLTLLHWLLWDSICFLACTSLCHSHLPMKTRVSRRASASESKGGQTF